MKTMKIHEAIKCIADTQMPDIEQVRANCLNQASEKTSAASTNTVKTNKKQSHKKAIMIIAVTALLFTLSGLAIIERLIEPYVQPYGAVIENLTFKGFNVNKVDEITLPSIGSHDGYSATHWWVDNESREILNYARTWWQHGSSAEWVNVKTLEEAGRHLVFTPAELNYFPEGCVRDEVLLRQYPQGNYDIHNFLIPYTIYGDNGNPDSTFNLFARYISTNATVKMNTIHDIEKIILNNGIEALLLTEDVLMSSHQIMWIKDGVLYHLTGSFERDVIIKMAESVE